MVVCQTVHEYLQEHLKLHIGSTSVLDGQSLSGKVNSQHLCTSILIGGLQLLIAQIRGYAPEQRVKPYLDTSVIIVLA